MNRPTERPERIEDALRPAVDEAFVADVWERIESEPPQRSAVPWLVGAVAVVVAAIVLLRDVPPEPIVAAPIELAAGRTTTFDDGSRVTLSADARFALVRDELDAFVLALESGVVTLDVRPGRRRWIVDAGLAKIEVVGTRFSVEHRGDRVDVEVERGEVLVASPLLDEDTHLRSGERITIEPPIEPSSAPPDAGVRAEPERRVPSAASLLETADAARRDGDEDRAARALSRLLALHPASDEAGYAAFTLARMAWDAGDHARAVASWERAIRAGLPEALERAAYQQLIEAHRASGDTAAFERVTERYRLRFEGRTRSEP